MLRTCAAQSPRAVASSSKSSCSLHTATVLHAETYRQRQTRAARKANIQDRAEREQIAQANRPHVVLGTRPDDTNKWSRCDLRKVLLTEARLLSAPDPKPTSVGVGELRLPLHFGFGVKGDAKKLIFEHLPALSAEASFRRRNRRDAHAGQDLDKMKQEYPRDQMEQLMKASQLAKLLDLRNANASGIAYENRQRIVRAFSEPSKPNDTGRPEVQAALLTMRIRNLWEHLTRFKKDIGNRRNLRRLVHQRAKILKYLKRLDRDRYDAILPRLALEPESVEGELVV